MKTVTFETLAEKLGGKIWEKGEMKRIYLDAGYNTKKMSTKTYVYQREDESFCVSCYIDCPSQNKNWIKSQQDEIISSVEQSIKQAIWEIENPEGDYDEHASSIEAKKQLNKKQQDFLQNIESRKSSWAIDYKNACSAVKIYDEKVIANNNATDEQKEQIETLEAEYKLIAGTPGSKKRRVELEKLLSELPVYPNGPDYAYGENGWMRIASKFSTVEEFIDFKIIQTKKELGIND